MSKNELRNFPLLFLQGAVVQQRTAYVQLPSAIARYKMSSELRFLTIIVVPLPLLLVLHYYFLPPSHDNLLNMFFVDLFL